MRSSGHGARNQWPWAGKIIRHIIWSTLKIKVTLGSAAGLSLNDGGSRMPGAALHDAQLSGHGVRGTSLLPTVFWSPQPPVPDAEAAKTLVSDKANQMAQRQSARATALFQL